MRCLERRKSVSRRDNLVAGCAHFHHAHGVKPRFNSGRCQFVRKFFVRYKREAFLLIFIGLTTWCVFAPTLSADFVEWDDDVEIYQNPNLGPLDGARLRWMFTDTGYLWRYQPLGWLGWFINYQFGGLNPFGYHLGNVLLHCLTAGLVFLVLRKLLMLGAAREGTAMSLCAGRMLWSAAAGALLWALHPLRVEPVAWVSGRLHCQAMFFLQLGLLCYLSAVSLEPPSRLHRGFYGGAVASFALSIFSYPIGLGFAGLLVVLDVYPLRRLECGKGWWTSSARRIWWEKLPFLVLTGLALAVTLMARFLTTDWAKPASAEVFGIFPRVMQAFYVWAYYVWKSWLPTNLSPVYTRLIDFQPASAALVASAAFVIGTSVLLIWQRRRWPMFLAVWVCYLIALIPMLGLSEHPHSTSDRYSYLPGVAWSVIFAAALYRAWASRSRRWVGLAVGAILILACATASVRQTAIWKNSVTLFEHIIATLGNDAYRWDAHHRLGMFFFARGRADEAVPHLQAAVELQPQRRELHYELGCALLNASRFKDAAQEFERLLELQPDSSNAHLYLGVALRNLGRTTEAAEKISQALSLRPDHAEAYFQLAVTWTELDDLQSAESCFSQAMELSKGGLPPIQQAIYFDSLAASQERKGNYRDAAIHARHARELAQTAAAIKFAQAINARLERCERSDPALDKDLTRLHSLRE